LEICRIYPAKWVLQLSAPIWRVLSPTPGQSWLEKWLNSGPKKKEESALSKETTEKQ